MVNVFARLYKEDIHVRTKQLQGQKKLNTKSMHRTKKIKTPENKEPSRITLKDRDVCWRLRALISHVSKDVKYSQHRY